MIKTTILNIVDPKVIKIPINECMEELISLKNQSELLYSPAPESPFTENDYTWLRKTVYQRLCQAQQLLPNNWYFRVYEGFRSIKVQKILFDQQYQALLKKFPKKNKEDLFYETTQLVSPVVNFDGSINIPAHNTGAAVDLEIVTQTGKLVDMGMAIKDWQQVMPELCLMNCQILSKNVKKNRKIFLEIMTDFDFVNYPTEWWHFSYGDRYWAYHKGAANAIYGSADRLLEHVASIFS